MLIDFQGLSFKEACDRVGYDPPERSGAQRSKKKTFSPRETTSPADIWQRKATVFVKHCHKELLKNKEQLAWLAARGINVESVERFKLGWNPEDLWRERKGWGVTTPGKKLWLPLGLIIPYIKDGRVARLRVRTTKEDLRYYVIPGSDMSAMLLPQTGGRLKGWVVTEAELDAILIAQEAGDLVGAVAMGNSSAKPDTEAHKELSEAAHVLNALDFDAAGAKARKWWDKTYLNSERWPVASEKDPGDYFKNAGGDIRAWVIAGLPPGFRPAPLQEQPESNADPPEPQQELVDDLTQVVNCEDDGLIPLISYKYTCKVCGRKTTVLMQEGRLPTKFLAGCFPHDFTKNQIERLRIIDDRDLARKNT